MSPEVDSRKRQTAIHRNDPNPFFDQQFKFPVSHEDLQDKTLILQVFDYDRFSRNDVIGEVRVNMCDVDVTSSIEIWGDITKHKKPPEELQEILLSLSYLPSAERLTVVLLKARNLFCPQEKESIDPFVKVYLLSNGKRVKKKKTAARKCCSNPVWNEALTFNISSSNLSHSSVEICVMYQGNDLIGNPPLLGSCVIGPHEEGPGQEHWADMTQSPRKAVAMWHTLR
uniref:C2 domain-containing protein n=2 Tax=Clastoptera arizonana TaxID=38151 RepID=A0A1B6D1G6_9HEMI